VVMGIYGLQQCCTQHSPRWYPLISQSQPPPQPPSQHRSNYVQIEYITVHLEGVVCADGPVQRGLVLSTVCKQFARLVGSCDSANWTTLEYGAPSRSNASPPTFQQLHAIMSPRPHVTTLSASLVDLQVVSSSLIPLLFPPLHSPPPHRGDQRGD